MPNYGEDKEIYITNTDDYTHVIILNTAMPPLPKHIPKQNIIGFAFEPPKYLNLTQEFVDYAKKYIGKYFIGDVYDLGEPFVERYSHMWHNPPLKWSPMKLKTMSLMVSEKMSEIGHLYRHTLVNKILESDLPIDIYGRGCKYYQFMEDPRIKGEFDEYTPYENYKFHISIENMPTKHYFSEKIMNPLLCNTTPIYMGCDSIQYYFPDMTIKLSGNIEKDVQMLCDICENPDTYKTNIDINKVKDIIYLLRNLDNLFGNDTRNYINCL